MTEQQKNNPLHGVKLETLLTELVEHYGFDILAEQINLNCFKTNPSIKSGLKFLRRTAWARAKVEAFYLYKYKGLPKPSDHEYELPPRERLITAEDEAQFPAIIQSGDSEFHDDPKSGPRPYVNKDNKTSRRALINEMKPQSPKSDSSASQATPDPWGKWREENE